MSNISRWSREPFIRKAAAVILLLVARGVIAQDPDPISTDRPSIANSSVVVPKGNLQFENGVAFTRANGYNTVDGSETEIRYGVAKKTELRLIAPDYTSSGFNDMSVGFKQQLGPAKQFDVSLIIFLSLPSGANAISSHGYDPAVQVPWSRKLSTNWTAAGQLAVYWPTQGKRRNTTGESTLLVDRQLTKRWDAFAEYAGDFPQSGGPRHLVHFGAVCKLATRHQLDIHGGAGLSAASAEHFFGLGYSFRFK